MVGQLFMNLKIKKSGYTLSEVMVALSLIGVLATLTLSTVGASIQQRARLSEFRTAYARMETVLRDITFERGNVYACYSGILSAADKSDMGVIREGSLSTPVIAECDRFLHDFTRAMGATHSCESNPVEEGCMPPNYPKTASGCTYDFKKSKRAYVFDNGMIFMTYYHPDAAYFPVRFALDVNGRKGPNKWGQDIFAFSLTATETRKINEKTYVKEVRFTGIQNSDAELEKCYNSPSGKSTKVMMKESAGIK